MTYSKKTCPNCEKGQSKPVPVSLTLTRDLPSPLIVSNLKGRGCDLCGCVFINTTQSRQNQEKINKAKTHALKRNKTSKSKKGHFKKNLGINEKKAKKEWLQALEERSTEKIKWQLVHLPPSQKLKGSLFEGFLKTTVLPKLLLWWEKTWLSPSSSIEQQHLSDILCWDIFLHNPLVKTNPKYLYHLLANQTSTKILDNLIKHPKANHNILLQFGIIQNSDILLKHILDQTTQVSPSLSHHLVLSNLSYISKEIINEPDVASSFLVQYLNYLEKKYSIPYDQNPCLIEALSFGKTGLVASLFKQNPTLKISVEGLNHIMYSFRHSQQLGNTKRCDGIVAGTLLVLPTLSPQKTTQALQKHPQFFDALCQKAPPSLIKEWALTCSKDNANLPQQIQNFHLRAQLEKTVLPSSLSSPSKKM